MQMFRFILCLVLLSCGANNLSYNYKIALDPSWRGLEVPGRENALTLFSSELIEAIGKEQHLKIAVYEQSWDTLMLELQENHCQAICTPMQPYVFYEKLYLFSDVYLPTGPVLVSRIAAPWDSLKSLANHEVGIVLGTPYALMLEKYPNILQKTYSSIQTALDDLAQGNIAAVVLDILSAEAYTHDLYQGRLQITSSPLTQEGIRLVSLQGKSENLIRQFNKGLAKLKKEGTYTKIARKWGVGE